MKKLILLAAMLLFMVFSISSCEEAIEENIGSSHILMSRTSLAIAFTDVLPVSGTDTLYNTLRDTTILSIGVYRSGLSSRYPEVNLKVRVDSTYLKSLIQQANDPSVPDAQKSSSLLSLKHGVILPPACYQLTPEVKIESGKMVGNVMLVVNKSKFAKLKSAKVFLPIAIDTLSVADVATDKAMSVIQLKNAFEIKRM